jgi:hypothetical protein
VWCWCGGVGGVVVVFFTDYNATPTKVVLSCFGLLVGLWQFAYTVLSDCIEFLVMESLFMFVDKSIT